VAKILVIDDNPHIRRLLARVLEKQGHTVILAEDSIDGVAKHNAELPNLVITDMNMPRQGGAETILNIRQHTPAVKIVAISGDGDIDGTHLLIEAERLGAVEVLSKPFKMIELADCVRHVLDNLLGQATSTR
jgi:two-component system nitrogen regulation response regulator NtrX